MPKKYNTHKQPSIGDKMARKIATKKPAKKKPKALNSEIDTSKGAVSIKAKSKASTAKKNTSYSVVMRGGVPTKVEDNGDEV